MKTWGVYKAPKLRSGAGGRTISNAEVSSPAPEGCIVNFLLFQVSPSPRFLGCALPSGDAAAKEEWGWGIEM